MSDNPYRDLPSVDVLADQIDHTLPRPLAIVAARSALDRARDEIAGGHRPDPVTLAQGFARAMQRSAGTRVINATGVLLHTNLGRAPWSALAIAKAATAASGFGNVEIDLETGERGRRGGHVALLLRELTGAEDALVVNNNASAVLLTLAATTRGKSVPVSRGELIEIGGSYRLPAVMEASGARMIEVGTTNRTRLGDYRTALQLYECGAILKVHPSNYTVTGFTQETTLAELSRLAAESGIPLVYDIGSGLLDDSVGWVPDWLRGEPAVRQSLAAGANLVTFSGDKLLGGPQAGIIVGSSEIVAKIRSDPLARALRVDAVTYAALAATLVHYIDGSPEAIPFWRYALISDETLRDRCHRLAREVSGTVEHGFSAVGAGSAPGTKIPTPIIRIDGADDMFQCLLDSRIPILARREGGALVIDLRAVDPEDDGVIVDRLRECR